ncbi:MAG: TRAP transporter TatT component family protein [Spirochaetaceae bacterium]|nr:TRAP transporter TatT component family protein [Spirochaetaceae bacterium]
MILKTALAVYSLGFCVSCMTSPALVGTALPLIISGNEKKLTKKPDDAALRLETGSYCVMYANAFVAGPANMLPPERFSERDRMLVKAKRFYLEGASILREGLEKKYPGFDGAAAANKLPAYLSQFTKDDVPALYWMVAGTVGAYSLDPFDLDLGFKIPEMTALIKRAYELDSDFNNGALDDFFMVFYGALPAALGGDPAKAKIHFERAVKKTGGNAASPYVSYVEVFAIPAQNQALYDEYIAKALSVNFKIMKSDMEKLANKIAVKKARFYRNNRERFIPTLVEELWISE